MKTKLIAILVLAFVSFALAGTFTITTPAADDPRISEAFGAILALGRPATAEEVQGATIAWLNSQTLDYERRKNIQTFSPPPLQIMPSPTPTPGARGLTPPPAAKTTPTATPKKKK